MITTTSTTTSSVNTTQTTSKTTTSSMTTSTTTQTTSSTTTSSTLTTFSSTTTTTQTSSSSTTSTATPYAISIVQNGNQIASLTLADLKNLPQVTSTQETGPTLLSVLNSVGVQNFTQVTINGYSQGRTSTATTTLQKAQITDNVILALVNRGTAKLTGSDVNTQIIDVNQIVIQ